MTGLSSVRLGFVGLGNVADLHCTQLQQQGLEASITAGMDVDPKARQAFADTHGVSVYEDPEELFEAVDAVCVTTPNRHHEEYVVEALEAGLDVLVEKPLAHTLASAERITEAAADADGFCMVGFHKRFANPVQVLVDSRDEGQLGEITHLEANYVRRRGVPGRGSWFTRESVAGGGALVDIGAHAIDLALHLLDDPTVVEVAGQSRAQFGTDDEYAYVEMWGDDQGAAEFSVDDSATAFVRCADGATVSLEVAWASNRPPSQEYFVRGTEAGAKLDLADESLTLYETRSGGAMHHRTTEVETRREEPHGLELRRFIEAVDEGQPPELNTVEQALRVQRVIDAIYRSSEAGGAVSFDRY